jgi:hypothetical protein
MKSLSAALWRYLTIGAVPRALMGLSLATIFAGSAQAEVKSVTANGFEVVDTLMIEAPAERVYAALGEKRSGRAALQTATRPNRMGDRLHGMACRGEEIVAGSSVARAPRAIR